MIGIYHSRDLDGWTSAAIMKKKFPYIKLIGYDYGQDFDIDQIEDGEEVIMADVSMPMVTMGDIAELTDGKFTWIDHHQSAINEYNEFFDEEYDGIKAVLDPKLAACELCWQHFFFPDEVRPKGVWYLGMYDSFRHKGTEYERDILLFQYAARSMASNPYDAALFLDYGLDIGGILDIGQGIYEYLCVEAKQTYAKAFPVDFDGCKFAAVNQERFNPINFGIDYHKDGYDGFACFWYKDGKWSFSLYNDNGEVNCSVICQQRGGGGHKGAAGFVTNDISFLFR